MTTIQVDIVSAEAHVYSEQAESVIAIGALGELGIFPGHTQLLTTLKPGPLRILKEGGEEEILHTSGGILEVQPNQISVLVDTVIRAETLDETAALEAKSRAEELIKGRETDVDYAKAITELAQAVAQLQSIAKLKKKLQGQH